MPIVGFKLPPTASETHAMSSEDKLTFYDHTIEFKPNGVRVNSPNELSFEGKIGTLKCQHLSWQAEEIIEIQVSNALVIETNELTINNGNSHIALTKNQCTFSGKHLALKTNDSPHAAVCCQGDYQACPAASGSKPHIGSSLDHSSETVFINGNGMVRHGDQTTCHGEPNQVISHTHDILVDGQPIAHTLSSMQHGGVLESTQQILSLAPVINHENTEKETPHSNKQCLQITIRTFEETESHDLKSAINIKLHETARSITTLHQPVILSGLSLDSLENKCQIDIETEAKKED